MDSPPTVTALRGDTYITEREAVAGSGGSPQRRKNRTTEHNAIGEAVHPEASEAPAEESQPEIKINFDPQADILHCWFGDLREAITVDLDGGIVVRLHKDTHDVVGFTIAAFTKRFIERPGGVLSVPLQLAALSLSG
jgi:hypothetical protein